jgi:hypothetical protein
MTDSLRDDLQWLWGVVEDTLSVGRNRKLAEEVRVLAELAHDPRAIVDFPARSRRFADSLEGARRRLSESATDAVARRVMEIEWGTKPAAGIREEPADAKPTTPEATHSVIDLCDWLERVRVDSIPSDRGIEIAARKADAVLAAMKIARIDRAGLFDSRDQQIVESVATDSAEDDMHVCQTVQCGYRSDQGTVRPQRVMVYRFPASGPNAESDACASHEL